MDTDRDDGFTLVEVLIVALILGVLAGIAIPTFLNQRGKAYHAAMQSDLHGVVLAQAAWIADHPTPTSDPDDLMSAGYAQTRGVSEPHVVVTAATYVACVKHTNASQWLVYDSSTGTMSTSPVDCI